MLPAMFLGSERERLPLELEERLYHTYILALANKTKH